MDGIAAQWMERKGKMPVGQGWNSYPFPYAVIACIHNGTFRSRGDSGFYVKTDQVTGNPGQANGSGSTSKQDVIAEGTKNVLFFPVRNVLIKSIANISPRGRAMMAVFILHNMPKPMDDAIRSRFFSVFV